jgi:hypothetical protein
LSESKFLTCRSLAFWDDGEKAKLSLVTEETGHLYISLTLAQARLIAADLTTYVFKSIGEADAAS